MWVQLSTTCSNVLKQPNWALLVAVNHNQLWTMASGRVDPIHWSHPPPSWAVSSEHHVHSINQCNLSGTRTCNGSMRGNHLAYAVTQVIIYEFQLSLMITTEPVATAGTSCKLQSLHAPSAMQHWQSLSYQRRERLRARERLIQSHLALLVSHTITLQRRITTSAVIPMKTTCMQSHYFLYFLYLLIIIIYICFLLLVAICIWYCFKLYYIEQ